jgi:hypothetical protein
MSEIITDNSFTKTIFFDKNVFLDIHDFNVLNTLENKISSLFELKKKIYDNMDKTLEKMESKLFEVLIINKSEIKENFNEYAKRTTEIQSDSKQKINRLNILIDEVNRKIKMNKLRLKEKIRRVNERTNSNIIFKQLDTDEDIDSGSNI